MFAVKLSLSPLRTGEQSLDNALKAVQMQSTLCWHVAPEEFGDTGMGSGAMGGAGEGEIRDESGLGSGVGVTGGGPESGATRDAMGAANAPEADAGGMDDAGEEDSIDLVAGNLEGSLIIPTDPEGTIIVDTDDDGIADVVVTDVDDDGNLDVIVFAGADAGAGNDEGPDAAGAPDRATGGNTGLDAALARDATGQDPMQGGVDFESGGNMGGPDDTGGIDVNALNTGEAGNPASS